MSPAATVVVLYSILFPAKGWFATNQPINIDVRTDQAITLVLTDFTGKPLDPRGKADPSPHEMIDIKQVFHEASQPGTYVLYAVPRTAEGKAMDSTKFVGTPLVIDVRDDPRREAPPGAMVTRVEPLRYANISTDKGDMTAIFYYDVAPQTVANFISLSGDGFYDGLSFFRIVPGMLIETGDPRGDGTGGPGYHIEAEFSNRQHTEGVLSMARQIDPIEKQGAMPRPEAANSAGSQFFICLNYESTKQLDRHYTAFGRVVAGVETLRAIGATPVNGDAPTTPVSVKKIEILTVTPEKNPYADTMSFAKPLRLPATMPAK